VEKYQPFQEDQVTLCQPSLSYMRTHTDIIQASGSSWFWFFWPLAAWNFLSTFKGDEHSLWRPKHVCNDSSLWHGQETLDGFCVNKATRINSHTNSNWLDKSFCGLFCGLEDQGTGVPVMMATKHNFSKMVSVPSAKTQLW